MLNKQKILEKAASLLKLIIGHIIPYNRASINSLVDFNRSVLFSWIPLEMPRFNLRSDLHIRKLNHEDFFNLTSGKGRFSEQARLYYVKRGIDTAYGVYLNEELVHMSWVYTASEYSKEPFQRLTLKDHEVEIVNCFTLEKCRGLGVYPYMIQFLSNLLFQSGIERIYMMADHKNFASQRGITKAGLKQLGQIIYIRIPATSSKSVYYRRYQSKNI